MSFEGRTKTGKKGAEAVGWKDDKNVVGRKGIVY
jgi:hypothetical protein